LKQGVQIESKHKHIKKYKVESFPADMIGGGDSTHKLNLPKVFSESVLDCRDIGIGTGFNGDDIDTFLKNSHDNLQADIENALSQLEGQDQLGQYKPI
jgi:hypothetical protein